MVSKKKVSVIVPIYNTEKYLRQCIESIIGQTYSNLEIILVNDGSTDNSGKIADTYAKLDSRIVVVHKKNGGVSSARNMGMEIATGDYIGFVDGDDWIESDMYQCMVDLLNKLELDMVICGYSMDYGDDIVFMSNKLPIQSDVFSSNQLLKYVFIRDNYKNVTAYVVNKLYRSELIKGDSFDTSFKICEDVLWFSQVAMRTQRVAYIDKSLYHYVQRMDSVSHSENLNVQLERLQVYMNVIELFEISGIEYEIIVYTRRFLAYHAMNIAKLANKYNNRNIFLDVKKIMEKYREEYISTNREHPDRIRGYMEVYNSQTVLVSVVCPLYYGEKYIDKILNMLSRISDKLSSDEIIEVIFVNDSPQNKIKISYINKNLKVYLIENEKNCGIHQSRINGLHKANGEYILFLDQDDIIDDEYLESQLSYIGSFDIVVCNGVWRGNKKIYASEQQQRDVVIDRKLFPYIVSTGQVLMRKLAIPESWMKQIMGNNGCDDAFLWNLLKMNNVKFQINPTLLYTHVEDGNNTSMNYEGMYASMEECCRYLLLEDCDEVKKEEIRDLKEKKLMQYSIYIKLMKSFSIGEQKKRIILKKMNDLGIKNIAIYGFGYFGKKLYEYFKDTDINIIYAIDREKLHYMETEIPIYSPEDEMQICDMLIVTAIIEYDEIEKNMFYKGFNNIVALDKFFESFYCT